MTATDQQPDQESAFVQAVVAAAGKAASDKCQAYWLLDQSALPAGWLERHIGRQPWLDVLKGQLATEFSGATPILVQAHASHEDEQRLVSFSRSLYGVARYANAVSLLTSAMPLGALQTAMLERSRVSLPGGMEAVLRWFDTRTTPLLPALLSPPQLAWLVQGIPQWDYVDRWGVWRSLSTAEVGGKATVQPVGPLVLSQEQEDRLVDDGLADAVIDGLLSQLHPLMLDRTPPAQYELVSPLVEQARRSGARDPAQALTAVFELLEAQA
jgi:hypothetical protein